MERALCLFLLVLSFTACSQEKQSVFDKVDSSAKTFPEPVGWINDFARKLTNSQIQELDNLIAAYENETSYEIAVVTIDNFGSYPNLFEYSLALANNWGVGKKEKDNGVLLILCPPMRELRIQTGLGIETTLTDQECQEIIDLEMIPHLKENNWYQGIKQGLVAIMDVLKR